MNHHYLPAVTLAALASVLTACGSGDGPTVSADCEPAHAFSTLKKDTLTVAVTSAAPYSMVDGQKPSGIDGDVVEKFAKEECLEISFKTYPYGSAVEAVKAGRVDLATGGFYRTKERNEIVTLSAPMYTDPEAIVSKEGYTKVDDLLGKKVATVSGYSWVPFTKEIYGADTPIYPDSNALFQDLRGGRIDASIDGFIGGSYTARDSDFKVEVMEPDPRMPASNSIPQNGLILDPKNAKLAAAVDAVIAQFHSDGTIVEVLDKYGIAASAADTGEPRLID